MLIHLPELQDAPAAWRGADFATPRSWVLTLTEAMREEIITAVRHSCTTDRSALAPKTFPLPRTKPLLDNARHALEHGAGFAVLAGFPVDALDAEEIRLAYAGVCAHLGQMVVQNGRGERMVDVIDKGRDYSHASRGYEGHARLPFHTDGTKGETLPVHYAALLCRETAASGGLSALASGVTLYATLQQRHPELVPVLQRGFHHHRQGDHGENEPPISRERIPVFSFHDGYLRVRYNRNNAEWSQHAGVVIEDEERRALEAADAILDEPGFALSMGLEPGDLQIINNFTVLHARTEYDDAPERKRHLLRLWISNPSSPRGGTDFIERFSSPESRFAD